MNAPILPEDERPLRLDAIAEWLGVAVKTVRRLIDSGKLKSVKMGGLRVVLRRDLKAYLEELKGEGGAHV
jgi:excisionase family DNA binding protein